MHVGKGFKRHSLKFRVWFYFFYNLPFDFSFFNCLFLFNLCQGLITDSFFLCFYFLLLCCFFFNSLHCSKIWVTSHPVGSEHFFSLYWLPLKVRDWSQLSKRNFSPCLKKSLFQNMNLYIKKNLNINTNNNHHFPDLDNLEDLVTTLTLPIPISSRSTVSLIANGVSLAGISIPALPAVSLDSLGLLCPLPAALRGLLALPTALRGLLALPCSAVSLGLADLVCGPGMLSARSLFLERFGISVLSTWNEHSCRL